MTQDPVHRRRIMRRSAAQEKSVAVAYQGQRTPGSGSGWRIKGDVRSDGFLFECKTTENKTRITISLADLKKVRLRSLSSGRVPVLTFDINGERFHVLHDADFSELIGGTGGGP